MEAPFRGGRGEVGDGDPIPMCDAVAMPVERGDGAAEQVRPDDLRRGDDRRAKRMGDGVRRQRRLGHRLQRVLHQLLRGGTGHGQRPRQQQAVLHYDAAAMRRVQPFLHRWQTLKTVGCHIG